MKVTNKTKFVTDDLRALARACVKYWDAGDQVATVVFTTMQRTYYVRGYCSWGRGNEERRDCLIIVYLPKDADARVRDVASTLEHEVDHARGIDHGDMMPDTEREMPWLNGLVIRHRDRKPNQDGIKLADAQRRFALAKASIKKAEKNLKRAWSTEEKWKRRIAYYEKKLK